MKPANTNTPTRAEALQLMVRLQDTIRRLQAVMESETRLIRAGDLSGAGELIEEKAMLAGCYQREIVEVRNVAATIGRLLPAKATELRDALAGLQDVLAVNLAVVGTARAIQEDLLALAMSRPAR